MSNDPQEIPNKPPLEAPELPKSYESTTNTPEPNPSEQREPRPIKQPEDPQAS